MRRDETFGTAALADLVAVEPGDAVLLLGRARDLARYLADRGASVEVVARPVFPLTAADASVDLAVLTTTASPDPVVLAELARVVRPGGAVLVGGRSRRPARHRGGWTVASARRELGSVGLEQVRVYGVRNSFQELRFLVPVDDVHALRWFVRNAFLPTTTAGAVLARVLTTVPSVATLLFRQLVLVARKAPPG